MTLFDIAHERDEAIAQVEANAGRKWGAYALAFIERYLRTHAELFGDDLWDAGLKRPHDQRALGAVIKKASRKGWMEATGTTRPRRSGHLAPSPVWRSTIYEGA